MIIIHQHHQNQLDVRLSLVRKKMCSKSYYKRRLHHGDNLYRHRSFSKMIATMSHNLMMFCLSSGTLIDFHRVLETKYKKNEN